MCSEKRTVEVRSLTSTNGGLRMMTEAGATSMDHEPFIVLVLEPLWILVVDLEFLL